MKINKLTLSIIVLFFSLNCIGQNMSRLYRSQKNLYHLSDFGFKGKVKKITNKKSTYEFSEKGLLLSYSFFDNEYDIDPYLKVVYDYDKKGDLITKITYRNSKLSEVAKYKDNKLTSWKYGRNNINENEKIYTYDSLRSLTKVIEYNSKNQITSATNHKIVYNDNGKILEEKEFITQDSVKRIRSMYKYLYDTNDTLLSEIYYDAGNVEENLLFYSRTNYTTDSIGNKFTEYIRGKNDITYTYYDNKRNIVKTITSGCLKKIDELKLYSYDEIGNKTSYSYQVRKNKDHQSEYCNSKNKVVYIKDKETNDVGVALNLEEYNTDEMYQYYDNKYEYEYDYNGNWIKKISYIREINSSGFLKPIEEKIETRKIEYYY